MLVITSNNHNHHAPCTVHSPPHPSREAWAQEPERRPSFLEINDRLNALLTELACPDEFARLFWRRHFAAQDRVPWREVVPALCTTFGVPPPEEPGGRNLSAEALPPNATPQMLHKARASALKDLMRLSPECSAMALEEFRRRDNIEKLSSLRTVLGMPRVCSWESVNG